jgi:GT2 family glycosyltransferase
MDVLPAIAVESSIIDSTMSDSSGQVPPMQTLLSRVNTSGKFFSCDRDKFYLRGVTYGPFKPQADGCVYHNPMIVERDFSMIAAHGINTVRTYTAPPRWVLDIAADQKLRVMAGIPWTQHVAFLDHHDLLQDSYRLVEDAMDRCGGHPALLALAIGNEIPAPVVRWYGHRRIENHLHRLCRIVKRADPHTLVTYANYPTTEYLELPFLDFVSFNVYLDVPERFDAYLSRLQNIAGERPLVLSEIGIDIASHGEAGQAAQLAEKIDAIFAGGAAGMCLFSFTDEWHRHGAEIHQWKFGLVDRHRKPRISLDAVKSAYSRVPHRPGEGSPRVSVVICSYNGAPTIGQTIEHALKLDYPDYEIIVVNDGSTNPVTEIASRYPVNLIEQENRGLSVARNTGLHAAIGDIVAYIDDDAYPDPHWLTYLVRAMLNKENAVGAGGPNLAVPEDGETAECIAHAPGGPTHVLLQDTVAEHIPGCNMAFFRKHLLAIGGFDSQFRIAGDDVDICWRLQNAGGILAFAPAAQVWHHRRCSVKAFWKQQVNYGKAEADLERKWPEKYNLAGHVTWAGRVYGKGAMQLLLNSRRRIYHGVWGEALFQQVYHVPPGALASLPMMPEWYVLLLILAGGALLGIVWSPLLLTLPLLFIAMLFAWAQAFAHARRAVLQPRRSGYQQLRMRLRIATLYRLQPLARFIGRYRQGLTPWRLRGVTGFVPPIPSNIQRVMEKWKLPGEWLQLAESRLKTNGVTVMRGSDFDHWDLEVRGGLLATVRVKLMTEDLGDEKQLVRWRATPMCSSTWMLLIVLNFSAAIAAMTESHAFLALFLAITGSAEIALVVRACGAAMATFKRLCVADGAA